MRNRNIVIAEATSLTGGRRDQILAESGLADRLSQLADEMTNQYVVTYSRPETLIPPEKIDVSVTKPGLTVRAPKRLPGSLNVPMSSFRHATHARRRHGAGGDLPRQARVSVRGTSAGGRQVADRCNRKPNRPRTLRRRQRRSPSSHRRDCAAASTSSR